MKVRYSYLKQQFSNCPSLWKKLKLFVDTGDFTLGKELRVFETKFAKLIGSKYAVGVNSGTDALKLSLEALDIGYNDEVILPTFTFYATLNPIIAVGAKPIFVDSKLDFNINEKKIITKAAKISENLILRTIIVILLIIIVYFLIFN